MLYIGNEQNKNRGTKWWEHIDLYLITNFSTNRYGPMNVSILIILKCWKDDLFELLKEKFDA